MRGARSNRTVAAAAVVALAIAGLLAAWFASGWSDVGARAATAAAAPAVEAARRGADLARELRAQIAALGEREGARPYAHYQNLFHDARAGGGRSVAPSPLASGSPDPLVLGYFQRELDGRITVPAINDDVPEMSDAKNLAANRAFRDEVIRSIAPALVAEAPAAEASAVAIDPSTYVQNSNANVMYHQQNEIEPQAPLHIDSAAAAPVTITISALAWHTFPFAGAPALVVTRTVAMPTGTLVQGFVIGRPALTAWLAARAGDAVATLARETGAGPRASGLVAPDATLEHGQISGGPRPAAGGPDPGAVDIAPGWHLAVAPNPRAVAAATEAGRALVRAFVIRFVLVGIAALIAGAFVVWLVARAEALARERSQFAAAAAHELRTPLAGLQLYGDMLADGLGDPAKVPDYARRMSEEAARLGRVVSNVLGFSQLERGNLAVEPKVDSLAAALRELAARAEPALDRAGCALALDVPAELDARFDRDAVARIVGNLLDNAEKYTRAAGDRTITLAARTTPDRIEVVVADRGPGVARPAALFAPFARGVPADGPAGLGLGLALSRSLARAMAGELAYRAPSSGGGGGDDGGGAEFVLSLPAV